MIGIVILLAFLPLLVGMAGSDSDLTVLVSVFVLATFAISSIVMVVDAQLGVISTSSSDHSALKAQHA